MWPPADVEASSTHDDIELMLHAVRRLDSLRSNLLNTRRHNSDVVLAQRLEVPVAWCWPPAPHGEVFGHDQVGDFRMARELGPHVLLRELLYLVSKIGHGGYEPGRRAALTYISGFLLLL